MDNFLRDIPAYKYIKYYYLPSSLKTSDKESAHSTSFYLGLDALLWGVYLDSKGSKGLLNIFKSNQKKEKKESHKYDNEIVYNFFPYKIIVDNPALTFSRKNYEEVYYTLIIAIIQTLQARIAKRMKQDTSTFLKRDELYYSANKIIDKLLFHLVYDSLHFLPDESILKEALPSVQAQVVEMIGKWIGQKLNYDYLKFSIDSEDIKNNIKTLSFVREQLYTIAEKCSLITPYRSEHLYRMGAIACIDKDEEAAIERALNNFKEAKRIDESSIQMNVAYAWVLATQELKAKDLDEFSYARFAAYAAYLINNGDEYYIEGFKKEFEGLIKNNRLAKELINKPLPIAIQVIDKMLEQRESKS